MLMAEASQMAAEGETAVLQQPCVQETCSTVIDLAGARQGALNRAPSGALDADKRHFFVGDQAEPRDWEHRCGGQTETTSGFSFITDRSRRGWNHGHGNPRRDWSLIIWASAAGLSPRCAAAPGRLSLTERQYPDHRPPFFTSTGYR